MSGGQDWADRREACRDRAPGPGDPPLPRAVSGPGGRARGMSAGHLSMLERGERRFERRGHIEDLVNAIGCSVTDPERRYWLAPVSICLGVPARHPGISTDNTQRAEPRRPTHEGFPLPGPWFTPRPSPHLPHRSGIEMLSTCAVHGNLREKLPTEPAHRDTGSAASAFQCDWCRYPTTRSLGTCPRPGLAEPRSPHRR